MGLRDKLAAQDGAVKPLDLYARFGVLANPFPSANQTSNNPHYRVATDDEVESRIVSFLRDDRSQVVVIEGTQGVGKTNCLNFFESELKDILTELDGYYVVRYLADPEASFEGAIRRLFQELGDEHMNRLGEKLSQNREAIDAARGQDMRTALHRLARKGDTEIIHYMMDWLLGFRLLKAHKEILGVQFRLDTVESKSAALRDIVLVSSRVGILKGIFLLLDELEKQAGVLSPTGVVKYLSAMRAIIDSLPKHLFMMIAVTPDAMRRYSEALPALRSRLQNQITLAPLSDLGEATMLAKCYAQTAREEAEKTRDVAGGNAELVTTEQLAEAYEFLRKGADRRGDRGVRQREFLHRLHILAEERIQTAG